jgi:hypothetical protein
VADHQSHAFGEFRTNLDSGTTMAANDHELRIRFDVNTHALSFVVDGVTVSTVTPQRFEAYRIGLGLACSYDPDSIQTCQASLRDYRFATLT